MQVRWSVCSGFRYNVIYVAYSNIHFRLFINVWENFCCFTLCSDTHPIIQMYIYFTGLPMNSKLCPSTDSKVDIFMGFGDELQRCKGEPEKMSMSNTAIARIIRRDKNKFVFFLDALFRPEEKEELQKMKRREDKYIYFSNLCEGKYNLWFTTSIIALRWDKSP